MLHALILAAVVAHAADAPEKYTLCRENPKLERTTFVGTVGGPDGFELKLTFLFDHCAVSGREKDRPMEVQRVYRATEGGQGLVLTTQLGSLITSARLVPNEGPAYSGGGHWNIELGPFFTSDLLSGRTVDAGRLQKKMTMALQALKAPPAAR